MDKETIKSILLAHGFTIKPGCDDLADYVYEAAFELLELAAPAVQGEPVAWIRKWSLDGEKPTKERNKSGRMECPMKYKLHEVTRNRYLPDDVALYTAPKPAPETQIEVVGWQFYQDGKWWNGDDRIRDHKKNTLAAGFRVRDVYATQLPAQQPDDSAAALMDKQCRQDVAAALGFPCGGNYAWSYLLQQIKDVAGLVEALSRCRHQASYSIGGEDALKVQLEKVRDIVSETLHALAAHRKGGDK